jgi:hypothetical protein
MTLLGFAGLGFAARGNLLAWRGASVNLNRPQILCRVGSQKTALQAAAADPSYELAVASVRALATLARSRASAFAPQASWIVWP